MDREIGLSVPFFVPGSMRDEIGEPNLPQCAEVLRQVAKVLLKAGFADASHELQYQKLAVQLWQVGDDLDQMVQEQAGAPVPHLPA